TPATHDADTASSPSASRTGRRGHTRRRSDGSRSATTTTAQKRNGANRSRGSAFRPYGHRPEEFLVLRGQLEGGIATALGATEEDAGVGALAQDFLDRVTSGVRRRQR